MYPLKLNWGRIGSVLAATIAAGVAMFPAWADTPAMSLLIKFPVGLLAVAAILRFMAPEVLSWAIHCLSISDSRN
jgi:hypothetical protein